MADGLAVGTRIGGYRVTREIGRGGMGVVYIAEDLSGGGEVALKVLPAELAQQDDFRRRFLREASYASQLEHPNIVSVHDAGHDGGRFYIAMEYIPGRDLAALLASEGGVDIERALSILSDVASALDALHAAGLLHRDVKPGNVLVVGPDEPHAYLTDFGLAKNPTRDSVALTALDSFVGTLDYVAPELILNEVVDQRADVYSLACVLYECLSGQPPFGRIQGAELMRAHIQDAPTALRAVRPDLTPTLEDVVMRGLAKSPADRFASCGELVAAAREGLPAAPAQGAAQPVGQCLELSITAGSGQGTGILVEHELVIGRAAGGDGTLAGDAEISRRHARIFRVPQGAWAIEDLGSTNGTFVSGARIESSPHPLAVGDSLQLGGTLLMVESVAAAPAAREGHDADRRTGVPTPEGEPGEASEPSPAESAEPATTPPRRVSLKVDIDLASGEIRLELDGSSSQVTLTRSQGRWRVQPP